MKRLKRAIRALKLTEAHKGKKASSFRSKLFPEFSIFHIKDKIIAYRGLPGWEIGITFPTMRGESCLQRLPLKEEPKAKRDVKKLTVTRGEIIKQYVLKSRENPEKEIVAHKKVENFVEELFRNGKLPYFCVPKMLGFEINLSRNRGTLIIEPIAGIPLSRIDLKGVSIEECVDLLRTPIRLMAVMHKGIKKGGKRVWLRLNDPRFKNIIVHEEFFAGKTPKIFFIDFEKANLRSSQKRFDYGELHDLLVFLGDFGFMFGLRVGKSSILKTSREHTKKAVEIVKRLLEEYFMHRFDIKRINREKMRENVREIVDYVRKTYGRIEEMENITVKMAALLLKKLEY